MKKHILIVLGLLAATAAGAQLSVVGTYTEATQGVSNIGHVFLFAQLDASTEINYTGGKTPVNWYQFSNLTTPISSGVNNIYPDDATGYLLLAGTGSNRDSITFYVIDYSGYPVAFDTLTIDDTDADICTRTPLNITGTLPALTYQTLLPSGIRTQTLPREFSLTWNTLEWQNDTWSSSPQSISYQWTSLPQTVHVDAPLCDTYFCVSGDQYATQLGLVPDSMCSSSYPAVAVACHPTSITVARNGLNEIDRPDSATIDGSGLLEIEFKANPTPGTRYYQWQVLKGGQTLVQRFDENHRYTFAESGKYTVSLVASNATCQSDSSTLTITIKESSLDIPNVFTPNGDGFNDEFRVAYRSLSEFHAWIYNRWGRKVYEWSDPAKGWDGSVNGHKATSGTYFYLIKAKGTDGVEYKRSGDINLIGR